MILLLDAGNTRLKFRLAEHQTHGWRYVDETRACLHDEFDQHLLRLIDDMELLVNVDGHCDRIKSDFKIEEVLVCCVAGSKVREMVDRSVRRALDVVPKFAYVSERACGVTNLYQTRNTLGVDRWVAALGCSEDKGVNRIIVDAGTAVTVDLLDAHNSYYGGAIFPGSRLLHDTLVGKTAGIDSEWCWAHDPVGRTTQQCVTAGASYGLIGAIERLVHEFMAKLNNHRVKARDIDGDFISKAPWALVLSGGDAETVLSKLQLSINVEHNPNLVFDGLIALKVCDESDFNRVKSS